MTPENELFTALQTSEYLKVSVYWLDRDRLKDKPEVPFVRIGRMIRYRKTDLVKYINSLNKT